jgi:UDP-N-acetyl-D-galactosamine dehydrogenase
MDKIAIVGAGIVGLDLAICIAKHMEIHVYNKSQARIEDLVQHHDNFGCFSFKELESSGIIFHNSIMNIKDASIFILAVPTNLDKDLRPDLSVIKQVTKTIASILKPGDIIIVESSVYPGACRELLIPILEKHSGLTFNTDFYLAYAPERYSPNDIGYEMKRMVKLIALSHPCIKKRIYRIYEHIVDSIYLCPSIEIAECAKILENTQRNTNIALMNEFSRITHALNIPLHEVIKAAATKKENHVYSPGLVGGYCLPVNPRYLSYQALLHGVDTPLLNTICEVNESMVTFVFDEFLKFYFESQKTKPYPKIAIFGLGYKPNVPDIRSSLNIKFVDKLVNIGLSPFIHDPFPQTNADIHTGTWGELHDIDICIIMLKHQQYIKMGFNAFIHCCNPKGVIMDIGNCFLDAEKPKDIRYWNL